MEKKLQKPDLTNYNLLIAQGIKQTHYKILLILLLEEFMKLIANMDMTTKKYFETSRIKHKDCECCSEYANVKDDLILFMLQ